MTEFDKWRDREKKGAGIWTTAAYKKGWKAALRMIKSEGVISDYELAGKIIKDELEE